jgi:replicative DNA helicase
MSSPNIRILGEKSTLRRTIFAAQRLKDRCFEATDGAAEILSDAEALLSKLADRQQAHGQWLTPGEVIAAHPGGINDFMQPGRGGAGTPTPWKKLNDELCGLHRGDLVLVAGRPSMGKSVIGMQLARHTAAGGEGAAVFSLEMTKDSLVRRLISAVGSIDAQRFRIGRLDREERRKAAEATAQIESLPLFIDDTRARTMPAVTSALRKLSARHPVRLIIIDHFQLMRGTGRFESRHHELSEISHSLKHLAGEMDVTIVRLSQLNRECEKEARQPRLADLSDTGSLEEDADVILFVHRPEQFKRSDLTLKGKVEFIIGKQRNGPTGKRNMLFQPEFQRFVEVTEVQE